MTKRNPEDYKQIIVGYAYKFAPSLKMEVADLIQDGYMCFMELMKYEEENGLNCSFEAALSNHIKTTFLVVHKSLKYAKRTKDLVPLLNLDMEERYGKNPWGLIEEYISMTKEMKEVVDTILMAPQEFIDLIRCEDFKTGLSKYLRKYKGWTLPDVNKFWEEFKLKEKG